MQEKFPAMLIKRQKDKKEDSASWPPIMTLSHRMQQSWSHLEHLSVCLRKPLPEIFLTNPSKKPHIHARRFLGLCHGLHTETYRHRQINCELNLIFLVDPPSRSEFATCCILVLAIAPTAGQKWCLWWRIHPRWLRLRISMEERSLLQVDWLYRLPVPSAFDGMMSDLSFSY